MATKKKATKKTVQTKRAAKKTTPSNGKGDRTVEDAPSKQTATTAQISIMRLQYQWARIWIAGTSLLTNNMTQSALRSIKAGEAGKKLKKEPRKPEYDWLESSHLCQGRYDLSWIERNLYGIPAVAIAKAMAAVAYSAKMHKNGVDILRYTFVNGPYDGLVPIYQAVIKAGKLAVPPNSKPCIPGWHEVIGYVRSASGKQAATMVYRPQYVNWAIPLDIRYWPNLLNLESTLALLEAVGGTVGIGSWRKEKGGQHGLFNVVKCTTLPVDYDPIQVCNEVSRVDPLEMIKRLQRVRVTETDTPVMGGKKTAAAKSGTAGAAKKKATKKTPAK